MKGKIAHPDSLGPFAGSLAFAGALLLSHLLPLGSVPGASGPEGPDQSATLFLSLMLGYWFLATAASGYLAGRLDRSNSLASSLTVGAIVAGLVLVDWLLSIRFGGEPGWWHALLVLGAIPVALTAGRFAQRIRTSLGEPVDTTRSGEPEGD
jgi:hypothetical protein